MGEAVGADWSPAKGLYLSGSVRKKLFGNLDEANRPSFSSLPHVRSDAWLYGRESDLTVPYLTAEYFMWRFATAIRDNNALTLKEQLRDIVDRADVIEDDEL